MLGFVNGLAIVIGLAQLGQFQVPGTAHGGGHGFLPNGEWLSGGPLMIMLALVALTMFLIWVFPKVTKLVPAPLAGIAIVAALVIGLDLDTLRVADLESIKGSFPAFHLPFTSEAGTIGSFGDVLVPLNVETLGIILPYALILAAIGLIESLLTLNLVGEITGQSGGASKECIDQGGANIITGFFGGMGGCAMIGQSMILSLIHI